MTRARENGRTSQTLLVSFLFSFTIAIVAPLHIYLTNRLEFAFSTREMLTRVAEVRIPDDVAIKYGNHSLVSRNQLPEEKGTALPLILIKRPGGSGPLVPNDAPVALADIPRTIASELGHAGVRFRENPCLKWRSPPAEKGRSFSALSDTIGPTRKLTGAR